METIYEKICARLFGGGFLDWTKLEQYINEIKKNSNYTVDDILNDFFDLYFENANFNELMYVVLEFYEKVIKNKMIKFHPELENEILEYEVNKHINYLDSYLDDECWWYDLEEYNKKEVVDEILEKWGILNNEKNS